MQNIKLENQLLKEFLKISGSTRDVFKKSVDSIYNILTCSHCTLWKVNHRSNTLSLLAYRGLARDKYKKDDFTHLIEDSFSDHILSSVQEEGFIVLDNIQQSAYFKLHKSKNVIISNNCTCCIAIVIPVHLYEGKFEALLYIYPKKEFTVTEEMINIIRNYFSLSFSNYYLSRKERLTSSIIQLHEKKGSKDIGSIIHPMINSILKEYIKYEAASAFVWDPFLNRLSLSATTGIKGNHKKEDVFYSLGEGLTGKVAIGLEPQIINLPFDSANGHEKKFKELKDNPGQSFLYIPIKSVVSKGLLGILRFVNRINSLSGTVDYFSAMDLKLFNHVSYLIGQYMEFDQSKKMMSGFSKQMSHEILTPAVGIRGLASRIVKHKSDQTFLSNYLSDYSQSILDYSTLQIAQTKTIEYAWKGDKNQPKNNIYNVEKVYVREIIENCKKLVFPLLRDENLKYKNINISGTFPTIFVDRFAFEPVFLNLLTNCIKYRKRSSLDPFKVEIKGHKLPSNTLKTKKTHSGYVIQIIDHGIGIPKEDVDNIFYVGYRRKGIEKLEIRGLGMGLTVVNNVLNDFFCDISLHSNKNPTEFRIFIPSLLKSQSYTKKLIWTSSNKQ